MYCFAFILCFSDHLFFLFPTFGSCHVGMFSSFFLLSTADFASGIFVTFKHGNFFVHKIAVTQWSHAFSCDVVFMVLVIRHFHAYPHWFVGFNNTSTAAFEYDIFIAWGIGINLWARLIVQWIDFFPGTFERVRNPLSETRCKRNINVKFGWTFFLIPNRRWNSETAWKKTMVRPRIHWGGMNWRRNKRWCRSSMVLWRGRTRSKTCVDFFFCVLANKESERLEWSSCSELMKHD